MIRLFRPTCVRGFEWQFYIAIRVEPRAVVSVLGTMAFLYAMQKNKQEVVTCSRLYELILK